MRVVEGHTLPLHLWATLNDSTAYRTVLLVAVIIAIVVIAAIWRGPRP